MQLQHRHIRMGKAGGISAPDPLLIGALGCSVWVVYLFDRIYDTRRIGPADRDSLPFRHHFVLEHPVFFRSLLFSAVAMLLAWFLPSLWPKVWAAGSLLAFLTLVYFLWFRLRGESKRHPSKTHFPAKETLIAAAFALACHFASGATPVGATPASEFLWLGTTAFFLLCLTNCLLISWSEREGDAQRDPSAFFAGQPDTPPSIPFTLNLIALSIGLVLLFLTRGGIMILPFAILSSAVAFLTIFLSPLRRLREMQALADGVLLSPWLALGWLTWFPH
ncbi:MAG: hypothetical protein AAGC68_13630 [Verrucomicrobiota bacterium]